MQSTASNCPPAIAKVTTPKPRKNEIIEAAAKLEFDKRMKAFEAQRLHQQNEESALRGRIQKFVEQNIHSLIASGSAGLGRGSGSIYDYTKGGRTPYTGVYNISFGLPHLDKLISPALQKALIAHHNKWDCGILPDGIRFEVLERPVFEHVKAQVKAMFEANAPATINRKDERVAAILADTKAVKALNTMLKAFQKPALPALDAPVGPA